MYELLTQDRQPGLDASANRIRSLLSYLGDGSNFTIDWTTGRTTVSNGDAIVNSIRKVIGTSDSSDPATDFLALIQDGFAVHQGSPDANDPNFRFIPWRSLFDVVSLQSMQPEDWNWLGINDRSQVADLQTTIPNRFAYHPDYMLDAAHLQSVSESAQFFIPRLQTIPRQPIRPLPIRPITIGAPLTPISIPTIIIPTDTQQQALGVAPTQPRTPTAGPPPPSPTSAPNLAQFATALLAFCEAMAPCFGSARWSIQWEAGLPIGVRICLGSTCAQKLLSSLESLAKLAAGEIPALIALVTAGGLAALGEIGFGGWVGLAILHFAAYWLTWITTTIRPGGDCLIVVFPFLWPLFGGLFYGWAEGIPG
jgi:hypothetical protein